MIRCNRGSLKISQLETRQPMEEAGLFRRLFDKIKRVSKKKFKRPLINCQDSLVCSFGSIDLSLI